MIITEKVIVKITNSNIKYYKAKNYNISIYDQIEIDISELSNGSNIKIVVKCDICGNEKLLSYKNYINNIKKWNLYSCSNKCSQIKNKLTNKLLYNDEKYNNLEKHKKTCILKYNVDSYSKTDEFKQRYNETCLLNNNVTNSFQLIKKSDRINNWLIKRYNIYNKYNIVNIDNDNKIYTFKCDNNQDHNFDISFDLFQNRKSDGTKLCTTCYNHNETNKSSKEVELYLYIKSIYNDDIILNDRKTISPYEIDILLPKLNLAFEFNGNFWHSDKNKDKYYHLNKFNLCKNKYIDLISVYEFDWDENKDKLKNKIYNLLFDINNDIFNEDILKLEKNWKYDKLLNNYKIIDEVEPEMIKECNKFNIFNSGFYIYKKIV